MRPAEPEEDASGDVPRKGVAETPVGDRKCASEAPPLPVQSVSFSNVTEECFDSFCKILLDDTSLNPCDRILQLLEQAPVQEPPREGAQAGAKSFQVGVYNHGGVTGLRAATHRYPHACRIPTPFGWCVLTTSFQQLPCSATYRLRLMLTRATAQCQT